MRFFIICSSFLICTWADLAGAQSVSPALLVEKLATQSDRGAVRSVGEEAVNPTLPLEVGHEYPTIALQIEFEPQSHLLTVDGMRMLNSIATALRDERLAKSVFQVAGHYVDLKKPASNQILSRMRAVSVAEHLSVFYGIAPGQLTPVGYGSTRLFNSADLNDSANDRVELVNVDTLR